MKQGLLYVRPDISIVLWSRREFPATNSKVQQLIDVRSDTAAAISTALAITAEDEESREDDYCKAMMFKLYELDVLKLCLGEDRWRTGQTLRQIERIGMKSTLALRKWQEKTRMGA